MVKRRMWLTRGSCSPLPNAQQAQASQVGSEVIAPIHSFPGISGLQHILPKSPQSLLEAVWESTQIFRAPSPAPPPWDLLTTAAVSTQGGWKWAPWFLNCGCSTHSCFKVGRKKQFHLNNLLVVSVHLGLVSITPAPRCGLVLSHSLLGPLLSSGTSWPGWSQEGARVFTIGNTGRKRAPMVFSLTAANPRGSS